MNSKSAWRKIMSYSDPVMWFSLIYGRWFQGQPILGFAIIGSTILLIASVPLWLLWMSGVERFTEQHPLANPAAQIGPASTTRIPPPPTAAIVPTTSIPISVYERNGAFWGGSADNNPILLISGSTIHPSEKNPVLITPVAQNRSLTNEAVASGTEFIVTIHFGDAKPKFVEPALWRPMKNSTTYRSFVATLDAPILPGPVINGPNESIKATFPKGKYKVEYLIQGMSEKRIPFKMEDFYWIEIQ